MTGNGQFVGFLSDKLNLSKSEIEHFRDNPLVDPDKTKEFVKNVAEKIKELCQKTKIGVAYEECERKGFQVVKDEHGEVVKKPDGSDLKKDVYKPTGKREEVIYGNEKKEPPKSEYRKFTDSIVPNAKSFVDTVTSSFKGLSIRGG
jgi:hypothetical protein